MSSPPVPPPQSSGVIKPELLFFVYVSCGFSFFYSFLISSFSHTEGPSHPACSGSFFQFVFSLHCVQIVRRDFLQSCAVCFWGLCSFEFLGLGLPVGELLFAVLQWGFHLFTATGFLSVISGIQWFYIGIRRFTLSCPPQIQADFSMWCNFILLLVVRNFLCMSFRCLNEFFKNFLLYFSWPTTCIRTCT